MKVIIAFCFLISTSLLASKTPCKGKDFEDFDFWLGDWTVSMKDGTVAGKNVIEKVNPCLMIESWHGAKGLKGSSMNYYDPESKLWKQHWVSADGTIIRLEGKKKGATLKMSGNIFYNKTNKSFPFRGEWTLLGDRRVRQFFEQQDPKSKEWKPWFEGFYKKTSK